MGNIKWVRIKDDLIFLKVAMSIDRIERIK